MAENRRQWQPLVEVFKNDEQPYDPTPEELGLYNAYFPLGIKIFDFLKQEGIPRSKFQQALEQSQWDAKRIEDMFNKCTYKPKHVDYVPKLRYFICDIVVGWGVIFNIRFGQICVGNTPICRTPD